MLKKIILIDGNITTRKTTKLILTLHGGFEVIDFANIEDTISYLNNNNKIDLIVSDIEFSGIDVFQFIKEIKEKDIYKSTPILITSKDQHSFELQNLSFARLIDGWLMKPFDEKVLMLLVKTYLGGGV